jgi:hypothetical protein
MIGTILNRMVSRLDPILRRRIGIFEFSSDERCILRISIHAIDRTVQLSDGTRIAKGDLFGDIHWWNEHMQDRWEKGKGLRSANEFKRNLLISLRQLAGFVRSVPEYRRVRAFRGVNSFGGRNGLVDLSDFAGHWGFELIMGNRPEGFLSRFIDYWERVYLLMLIRVYSFTPSKARRLGELKKGEIWISRSNLLRRYDKTVNIRGENIRSVDQGR